MASQRNGSKSASKVDSTGLNARGKATLAMLTALEDEAALSEWEIDFIANIADWFISKERSLSPKQYETLEKIYRKFN
jgi:hypothetical protein